MRFEYTTNPALPPLAWCLSIRQGRDLVSVECGPGVEQSPRFFVEGAWDAEDFASGQFDASLVLLGSGARLAGDGVVISTPSHTLEKLFVHRAAGALHASNSFAFLLARIGADVDLAYPFYVHDFLEHMKGVKRLGTSTPVADGRVEMYWCANLLIAPSLHVSVQQKPLPPEFASYEAYVEFLHAAIGRIHANCQSAARSGVKYRPLSTVSGGYDSPACSVLAKAIGCTDTITFPKARSGWESDDDDGTPVADVLGMQVHAFDRLAYMSREDFPEAEFAATGGGGDEVIFASTAELLRGSMLFTGYLGDTVWGLNRRNTNDFMRMLWPGGSSFGEFRLRLGFVHLPVPMIAYRSHRSIVDISHATEMAPWRIGGAYDRPIPRRLVEEAGVPREFFGRTKMAAAQSLVDIGSIPDLSDVMSRRSYADFQRFLKAVPPLRGVQRVLFQAGHRLYRAHLRLIWRLEGLAARKQMEWLPQPWFSKRYAEQPNANLYTFHWGVRQMLDRYRKAITT